MTKVLLVDNYDSFTYNLVHYLQDISPDVDVEVVRNDALTAKEAPRGYRDRTSSRVPLPAHRLRCLRRSGPRRRSRRRGGTADVTGMDHRGAEGAGHPAAAYP